MMSRPSCWNAGDAVMMGTHFCRNASAETRPPVAPFAHGASWPSSQVLGVMKLKFAVVDTFCRSVVSLSRFTTLLPQSIESTIEWKYMNGLWRVAYESPAGVVAFGASWVFVRSVVPRAGWPQVADSRAGSLPMSPS